MDNIFKSVSESRIVSGFFYARLCKEIKGFVYLTKMKKAILLSGISILSVIAMAHEFWLQPQRFFYIIREVAMIRFMVGENFKGENWSGNKEKILELAYFTPSGNVLDISSSLSANKGDSIKLPMQEEGTHMVTFNSTNSFIRLEADKFTEYLKEDGLDEVATYRKEHNEENKAGTEHYQRSVKTIVQVSDKITDACTKPTSLPLDIIPELNPYSVPEQGFKPGIVKVKFRVLFKKQPLNNALVKIWYRLPGKRVQMDTLRTNKKGWVTAERHPGPYMVSCVKMEPTPADQEAQWQSYWGSLSFEYSQFFPRAGNP
jgi:uncharacterized GH25 family protein